MCFFCTFLWISEHYAYCQLDDDLFFSLFNLQEVRLDENESEKIAQEIHQEFVKNNGDVQVCKKTTELM